MLQMKFITVPLMHRDEAEAELNLFLRTHKVLRTEHFLIMERQLDVVLIEYELGGHPEKKVDTNDVKQLKKKTKKTEDYINELTDETLKVRLQRFVKIRKGIADHEGIAPYFVFTNEELMHFLEMPILNAETSSSITDVDSRKLQKYIRFFFHDNDETSLPLDGTNS